MKITYEVKCWEIWESCKIIQNIDEQWKTYIRDYDQVLSVIFDVVFVKTFETGVDYKLYDGFILFVVLLLLLKDLGIHKILNEGAFCFKFELTF